MRMVIDQAVVYDDEIQVGVEDMALEDSDMLSELENGQVVTLADQVSPIEEDEEDE